MIRVHNNYKKQVASHPENLFTASFQVELEATFRVRSADPGSPCIQFGPRDTPISGHSLARVPFPTPKSKVAPDSTFLAYWLPYNISTPLSAISDTGLLRGASMLFYLLPSHVPSLPPFFFFFLLNGNRTVGGGGFFFFFKYCTRIWMERTPPVTEDARSMRSESFDQNLIDFDHVRTYRYVI